MHAQVGELVERVPRLTTHHHNLLYIVSLMPLVQRGCYVRCVLSYVFLSQLIQSPPDIGSFLKIKVSTTCLLYCYYYYLCIHRLKRPFCSYFSYRRWLHTLTGREYLKFRIESNSYFCIRFHSKRAQLFEIFKYLPSQISYLFNRVTPIFHLTNHA